MLFLFQCVVTNLFFLYRQFITKLITFYYKASSLFENNTGELKKLNTIIIFKLYVF